MSQRDLVAELRAVRTTAPAEVRERVRLIAAGAEPTPPRRFLRRRSLVLLVPIAAAIAGAVVLTNRGGNPRQELSAGRPQIGRSSTVPLRRRTLRRARARPQR